MAPTFNVRALLKVADNDVYTVTYGELWLTITADSNTVRGAFRTSVRKHRVWGGAAE